MSQEMSQFTQADFAAAVARMDALMPYDTAWMSTVAFLVIRDKNFCVHGTGTLVRIENEFLLITATHVIEFVNAQNLLVLRTDSKNKDDIIPLEAAGLLLPQKHLDITFLRLNPETISSLGEKAFLRLDQLCCELSDSMFVVVLGFPGIMSCHENGIISITKFHLGGPRLNVGDQELEEFDPKLHFLVEAALEDTMMADGTQLEFRRHNGEPAAFPDELGGISGGSVWKLADNLEDTVKMLPGSGKMVGVATAGYFPNPSCIKVSRLSEAIRLLPIELPHLRTAIEAWLGNKK